MTQTPCIAYFVVGLRLRQASVLCGTQKTQYAKASVVTALRQLSDAVIDLFRVVEPPAITRQQIEGLIQNCWSLVQQYADNDDYFLRPAYENCQGYLQTLETSLKNLANVDAVQSPHVNEWYELGLEVANGHNVIERRIIQPGDDSNPIRKAGLYSEKDHGWSFARPERVRELLSALNIAVGKILPAHTSEIVCPIPRFDRSLSGWDQIEAALPRLEACAHQADTRHQTTAPKVCKTSSCNWRHSYLGLMFDDHNQRVRRERQKPEIDLSSSLLMWHLLQTFASSRDSVVRHGQLRGVWAQYGREDAPTAATMYDGIGELRDKLEPFGIGIKSSRNLGWRLIALSAGTKSSPKKPRKPAKRRRRR